MRWGVNWQLVTGERRKKSLWSPPPPSSTRLPLPQLAPIYSLSRALFLNGSCTLLFLFLRIFGMRDWDAEPLGVSRWGLREAVQTSLRSHPLWVKRGQSLLNLVHHVVNWWSTPPTHTHTFRPRPHPAYCRNYSSAPWLHKLQLCWLNSSTLYQQVKTCGCCLTEGGVRNSTKHTQLY